MPSDQYRYADHFFSCDTMVW